MRSLGLSTLRHFQSRVEYLSHLKPAQSQFFVCVREQVRFQATSDKKFHCSVCKKSFRLEMAAKLHIQQAHSGDATIEAGAGPGQDTAAPAAPAMPSGPPTAPTVRSDLDDDFRRRERPTPRPLHQATFDVPPAAMTELLGVWDKQALARGVEGYVHSSMILKVYAAKPTGPEPGSSLFAAVPLASGPSPFDAYAKGARKAWPDPVPSRTVPATVPMAMASGGLLSAINPAWAENPFTRPSVFPKRESTKPVVEVDPTEAPLTPFGQLQKFGVQAMAQPTTAAAQPSSTPAAATPTSPFAAAAAAASPFAAAAQAASPFAAAAAAASPFAAAAQAASPFAAAAQAASPFAAAAAAASPFAAAAQAASPFAAAAAATSPFAAAAQAASPFGASPFGAASPFGESTIGATGDAAADGMAGIGQQPPTSIAVEENKQFVCSVCARAFTTETGLANHSKTKHNIELPVVTRSSKRTQVPDLPAYIPSPVDLSATSPFGTTPTPPAERWSSVELLPHAVAATNITLVGTIVERDEASGGPVLLRVRVDDEDGSEDIAVAAHGGAVPAESPVGARVCVIGSLRMQQVQEETTGRFYSMPIVHVTQHIGGMYAI